MSPPRLTDFCSEASQLSAPEGDNDKPSKTQRIEETGFLLESFIRTAEGP